MKIGLVSYEFNNGKIEYNIEKIEKSLLMEVLIYFVLEKLFCKALTHFLGIMK